MVCVYVCVCLGLGGGVLLQEYMRLVLTPHLGHVTGVNRSNDGPVCFLSEVGEFSL